MNTQKKDDDTVVSNFRHVADVVGGGGRPSRRAAPSSRRGRRPFALSQNRSAPHVLPPRRHESVRPILHVDFHGKSIRSKQGRSSNASPLHFWSLFPQDSLGRRTSVTVQSSCSHHHHYATTPSSPIVSRRPKRCWLGIVFFPG